jgi:hypothetical protein
MLQFPGCLDVGGGHVATEQLIGAGMAHAIAALATSHAVMGQVSGRTGRHISC